MDSRKRILVLILLCGSLSAYAQKSSRKMIVSSLQGRAYAFTHNEKTAFRLREGSELKPHLVIATAPSSLLIIDFPSNAQLVLGPRTQILIRGKKKRGRRLVSLLRGKVYFQTKPQWKKRPPGVLLNIRSQSMAYLGPQYTLEFTPRTKKITVLKGDVSQIALSQVSTGISRSGSPALSSNEDGLDDQSIEGDWGNQSLESAQDLGDQELTPLTTEHDLGDQGLEREDDLGDQGLDTVEDLGDQGLQASSNMPLDNIHKLSPAEEVDFKALLEQQKFDDAPADSLKIAKTKTQSDLKLFLRAVRYNQDVPDAPSGTEGQAQALANSVDFRDFTYDARLEYRAQNKRGKAFITWGGWIEYGNQSEIYRPPLQILNTRKDGRGVIELNEIFFLHSWADIDVSIGKKILKNGKALIISPSDRLTPQDLFDPLAHKDLGNWMVQVDTYFGTSSLTYAVIPYLVPQQAPRLQSRVTADQIPDGANPTVQFPDPTPKNFQNVFLFKTTSGGWDFFTSIFYGPEIFPVFREQFNLDFDNPLNSTLDFYEVYPKVLNLSGGFTTNISRFTFYGEALYQRPEGGKDDEYIHYVVGNRYKLGEFSSKLFMDEITLIMEYSQEKLLNQQNADRFIQSSTDNRNHKNNFLGRMEFQYNERLNLSLEWDHSFQKAQKLFIWGLEYKPIDGLSFRLNFEQFKGLNETPFGLFQSGDEVVDKFDRFTLSIKKIF